MKSEIKSIKRTEKQVYMIFNLSGSILNIIDNSFKALKPEFKLLDHRKYQKEEWLKDYYEFINGEFEFNIIIKNEEVRLKLKADIDFIDKFLESLNKSIEFAKYSKLRYQSLKN